MKIFINYKISKNLGHILRDFPRNEIFRESRSKSRSNPKSGLYFKLQKFFQKIKLSKMANEPLFIHENNLLINAGMVTDTDNPRISADTDGYGYEIFKVRRIRTDNGYELHIRGYPPYPPKENAS